MKFLKPLIMIIVCCCTITAVAQKSTETIKEEVQFNTSSKENVFYVDNMHGAIEVEGYNGKTIVIEVTKTITGKTAEIVAKGKREINLKVQRRGNKIYAYSDSPYTFFDLESGEYSHRENWNSRRSRRKYEYSLDFKIKVPKNVSIDVSTVNDGDIYVQNMHGVTLSANNVNGAITLKNVSGATDVNALNKDINIVYTENPTSESWYRSLNGDINIKFKEMLNANVSHRTMNGGFYTSYAVSNLAPKIVKEKLRKSKGVKYRVRSKGQFKIGNGGVQLNFDQLNGDTIVKN
jgi:hypothetical protein